jgi:hypothetical protein
MLETLFYVTGIGSHCAIIFAAVVAAVVIWRDSGVEENGRRKVRNGDPYEPRAG